MGEDREGGGGEEREVGDGGREGRRFGRKEREGVRE